MARNKLSAVQLKSFSQSQGKYGDGDGLWLYVRKTKSSMARSWVFIFIRNGRRNEIGLGPYGDKPGQISLREARARADEARDIVKEGGDPRRELSFRRATHGPKNFGECADDLLKTLLPTFRNEKHADQWRMTLANYAKPLRKIPVDQVTTDDVARVLRPIWNEKAETASRLRGRIEKVLDYAKAVELRNGENPARWKGHLDHVLGRQTVKKQHHKAMPYSDVPAFLERLTAVEGYGARALELTILCATRTSETLKATWSEIDFETAVWTIPGERMKSGKEHRIPLSTGAFDVLNALSDMRMSDLVFPGSNISKPLSNMTMMAILKRLEVPVTVHGFRSSFRDWAADETSFPREVAEQALAHRIGDATELAYRRQDALEKRRALMEAWSNYCIPHDAANIVNIKRSLGE